MNNLLEHQEKHDERMLLLKDQNCNNSYDVHNLKPTSELKSKPKSEFEMLKGKYSLLPDMKFGWRPKLTHGTPPIPLYFDFLEHPYWEFKETDTIVYYGFRPKTSFEMHEKYSNKTNSFGYPFTFPSNYKISQFKYEGAYEKLARFGDFNSKQEFVGMNPKLDCESLVFDSQFEGGNIDLVLKSGDRDNYYYGYIRPDTNSNGHLHWFYFSVTKAKFGQTVTINIPNFTKYTSLFEQGLKPSVFSWQKYKTK